MDSDRAFTVCAVVHGDRGPRHNTFNILCIICQSGNPLANQTAGGCRVLSQQYRSQCVGQLIRRTDLADLADLLKDFLVVHGVQGVLVDLAEFSGDKDRGVFDDLDLALVGHEVADGPVFVGRGTKDGDLLALFAFNGKDGAKGGVLHETSRTFRDDAAAVAWQTSVGKRLHTQLLVSVPSSPTWTNNGMRGITVKIHGYRVYDDNNVAELRFELSEGYTLDGEMIPVEGTRICTIQPGPMISFWQAI